MLTTIALHAADGLEKKARGELSETGGTWWGQGARTLGLAPGDPVETDVFVDLYTGFSDPRQAHVPEESRGTLGTRPGRYLSSEDHYQRLLVERPDLGERELRQHAYARTRSPLLCVDLTFAVPKSFSVLHAAFEALAQQASHRGAVEEAFIWHRRAQDVREAVLAGNNAMLETLQDLAGTARAGRGGQQTMDARGWVVASFLRTWSKARDPYLYRRNLVLNRVERADGKWRTLNSRKIFHASSWGAAVGERVASEALVERLGVDLSFGTAGLEVAGIPNEVLALFSVRGQEVREASPAEEKGKRYQARRIPAMLTSLRADQEHRHRVPGELVLWWQERLAENGLPGFAELAHAALDGGRNEPVARSAAVRRAQERVAEQGMKAPRSLRDRGWLALQINNQLPALGVDAAQARSLLAEAVATYQPGDQAPR